MKYVFTAGVAAFGLAASALATPQEDMAARCVEEGNEAEQCECAAEIIVETLDESELAFMLAVMDADTSEPEAVMTIAAEHGLDMGGMVLIGQKMQAAEPEMVEQCGIDAR